MLRIKFCSLVSLIVIGISMGGLSTNSHAASINTQDYTLCSPGLLTLTALLMDAGTNQNIKIHWFNDPLLTELVAVGVDQGPIYPGAPHRRFTIDVTINATRTYYLAIYEQNTNSYIVSSPVVSSTVTVNHNSISVSGTNFCGPGAATLVASGAPQGFSYKWYSADQSTLIGQSPIFITPSLSSNVTYYVEVPGYTCQKQVVNVIVNNNYSYYASNFSATAQPACINSNVYLSAGNAPEGSLFFWYNEIGQVLTSPNASRTFSPLITGEATYFVSFFKDGCFSSRASITVTPINPLPPEDQQFSDCLAKDIVVTPQTSAANLRWFNASLQVITNSLNMTVQYVGQLGEQVFYCSSIDNNGCIGSEKATMTLNTTADCEDDVNWVEEKAFDADQSVVRAARSYFDQAGNPLQVQQRLFEESAVLASQTIPDFLDRQVLSTLPAPIQNSDFKYDPFFVTSMSGMPYCAKNFDTSEKRLNADPVGTHQGSLGWYYSVANHNYPFVPKTSFPFSRGDYYEDGTGEARFASGPGDNYRFGTGHERLIGIFPVYSELIDYALLRNNAFGLGSQNDDETKKGVQTLSRDENGSYALRISDKKGRVVLSARGGNADDYSFTNLIISNNDPLSSNYRPMTYFYVLHPQAITITGSANFIAENIVTGEKMPEGENFHDSDGNWPSGFYRILLLSESAEISFSVTNFFADVSLSFFDDVGALKASISPNGYDALKMGKLISDVDKTVFEYDFSGKILSTTEPDEGKANYVYRKDGKIRFSQNAQQSQNGHFSYTHYDNLARPVESGEYRGIITFTPMSDATFEISMMKDELEKTIDQISWAPGTSHDWVKTTYDFPDEHFVASTGIENFFQEYVRNSVSTTENINIKTWYSYDEFGRIAWMAQKPAKLSVSFLTQYTYDFLGQVISVCNSSFKNGARLTEFYHYYEYDKDQRLRKVYTSTDGISKKIRATYQYYLHGPLKRIELGEDLQGIDFVYTIQGGLKQINHPRVELDPGDDDNDVFGMILDYEESDLTTNPSSVLDKFSVPRIPNPDGEHNIHGLPNSENLNIFQKNQGNTYYQSALTDN
jgi:hypothetical protein